MPTVARYRKFITAAGAGLIVLATVLGDGMVTGAEWWQVAAAVFGPLGVWALPNDPPAGTPPPREPYL